MWINFDAENRNGIIHTLDIMCELTLMWKTEECYYSYIREHSSVFHIKVYSHIVSFTL